MWDFCTCKGNIVADEGAFEVVGKWKAAGEARLMSRLPVGPLRKPIPSALLCDRLRLMRGFGGEELRDVVSGDEEGGMRGLVESKVGSGGSSGGISMSGRPRDDRTSR